jgi:hypothetical protein
MPVTGFLSSGSAAKLGEAAKASSINADVMFFIARDYTRSGIKSRTLFRLIEDGRRNLAIVR